MVILILTFKQAGNVLVINMLRLSLSSEETTFFETCALETNIQQFYITNKYEIHNVEIKTTAQFDRSQNIFFDGK